MRLVFVPCAQFTVVSQKLTSQGRVARRTCVWFQAKQVGEAYVPVGSKPVKMTVKRSGTPWATQPGLEMVTISMQHPRDPLPTVDGEDMTRPRETNL